MKVDIEHIDFEIGLFRKTKHYRVKFIFTFTDEEKAIIKDANLGDVLVFEVPPSSHINESDNNIVTFSTLVKWGFDYVALTPSQIQGVEEEVKEELPRIKEFLESNDGGTREDASLEF